MRAEEERHFDAEIERRVAERTAQLRAVVEELRENEERYRILHEAAFEGLGIHEGGRYWRRTTPAPPCWATKPPRSSSGRKPWTT